MHLLGGALHNHIGAWTAVDDSTFTKASSLQGCTGGGSAQQSQGGGAPSRVEGWSAPQENLDIDCLEHAQKRVLHAQNKKNKKRRSREEAQVGKEYQACLCLYRERERENQGQNSQLRFQATRKLAMYALCMFKVDPEPSLGHRAG